MGAGLAAKRAAAKNTTGSFVDGAYLIYRGVFYFTGIGRSLFFYKKFLQLNCPLKRLIIKDKYAGRGEEMKKVLPFLLAICLVLFLSGCSENNGINLSGGPQDVVQQPAESGNAAEPNKDSVDQAPAAEPGGEKDGETAGLKLGNELLMSKYHHLVEGKRVGLVTNQSGVNSRGISTVDVLAGDKSVRLTALYGPEHGIDGAASAGEYVESYTHPELGIPVYSLYGSTRMPTAAMLENIDVLVFDIQDIGARSYTYMSTLNYCMVAAQKYNKPVLVLDRPNPVGGLIVEGPVMEDPYITFVGVDNLPMAHGMTAGELAQFFNRKIGADLKVIAMEGYSREMVYQDTGLSWVQTSPNIPDLDSVFGYMATGLGEGTGIAQADKFKWIGGKGIDAQKFAALLNNAGLPGVTFVPEARGEAGGVRLKIQDYHAFNPARTGIYALTYAHSLNNFTVPKSGDTVVMFEKIMGTAKIGQYLEQGLTPQQIEAKYAPALNQFKAERQKYLIY